MFVYPLKQGHQLQSEVQASVYVCLPSQVGSSVTVGGKGISLSLFTLSSRVISYSWRYGHQFIFVYPLKQGHQLQSEVRASVYLCLPSQVGSSVTVRGTGISLSLFTLSSRVISYSQRYRLQFVFVYPLKQGHQLQSEVQASVYHCLPSQVGSSVTVRGTGISLSLFTLSSRVVSYSRRYGHQFIVVYPLKQGHQLQSEVQASVCLCLPSQVGSSVTVRGTGISLSLFTLSSRVISYSQRYRHQFIIVYPLKQDRQLQSEVRASVYLCLPSQVGSSVTVRGTGFSLSLFTLSSRVISYSRRYGHQFVFVYPLKQGHQLQLEVQASVCLCLPSQVGSSVTVGGMGISLSLFTLSSRVISYSQRYRLQFIIVYPLKQGHQLQSGTGISLSLFTLSSRVTSYSWRYGHQFIFVYPLKQGHQLQSEVQASVYHCLPSQVGSSVTVRYGHQFVFVYPLKQGHQLQLEVWASVYLCLPSQVGSSVTVGGTGISLSLFTLSSRVISYSQRYRLQFVFVYPLKQGHQLQSEVQASVYLCLPSQVGSSVTVGGTGISLSLFTLSSRVISYSWRYRHQFVFVYPLKQGHQLQSEVQASVYHCLPSQVGSSVTVRYGHQFVFVYPLKQGHQLQLEVWASVYLCLPSQVGSPVTVGGTGISLSLFTLSSRVTSYSWRYGHQFIFVYPLKQGHQLQLEVWASVYLCLPSQVGSSVTVGGTGISLSLFTLSSRVTSYSWRYGHQFIFVYPLKQGHQLQLEVRASVYLCLPSQVGSPVTVGGMGISLSLFTLSSRVISYSWRYGHQFVFVYPLKQGRQLQSEVRALVYLCLPSQVGSSVTVGGMGISLSLFTLSSRVISYSQRYRHQFIFVYPLKQGHQLQSEVRASVYLCLPSQVGSSVTVRGTGISLSLFTLSSRVTSYSRRYGHQFIFVSPLKQGHQLQSEVRASVYLCFPSQVGSSVYFHSISTLSFTVSLEQRHGFTFFHSYVGPSVIHP